MHRRLPFFVFLAATFTFGSALALTACSNSGGDDQASGTGASTADGGAGTGAGGDDDDNGDDAGSSARKKDSGTTSGGGDGGTTDPDGSTDGGNGGGDTDAADNPIKHVVFIIKENHTFDSFFGSYTKPDGSDAGINGTPGNKCMTSKGLIDCPEAPDSPQDMCHQHECALTDYDDGKMDGWDITAADAGVGNQVYAQYHREDIPNYYSYADHFTLADNFYASMLGPSFPGHMFTIAAQAGWAINNPPLDIPPDYLKLHPYWGCDEDTTDTCPMQNQQTCMTDNVFPCFNIPALPDVLPAGVDWKFYGSNYTYIGLGPSEVWSMFNAVSTIRNGPDWSKVVTYDQFDADVANGTLPAVSWLVNQDTSDEHPGGLLGIELSLCQGENWTVTKVNEVMQSAYWKDTVIFYTMDDFGGWYDHVKPPIQYGCDPKAPYGLGFRLPMIAISAYAKPGFVFHEQSEQASLVTFAEKIFHSTKTLADIDPSARDKGANDLLNAFDWNQTPNPPLVLDTRSCN
jgi:phospholipase C